VGFLPTGASPPRHRPLPAFLPATGRRPRTRPPGRSAEGPAGASEGEAHWI